MKRPLVFLHGWGQSSHIWMQQRQHFAEAVFLDLPGHGGAAEAADWLESLQHQLPDESCILVGWSLGALLAMQLAQQQPERITSLVLVGATPCFYPRGDWPHGCDPTAFQALKIGIKHDAERALQRFFLLMFRGEEVSRVQLKTMQPHPEMPKPSTRALLMGLALLREIDLRSEVENIRQPTLILHGTADAVVPPAAGKWLAEHLPCSRRLDFAGCGHAPFLTQSRKFNSTLEAWCRNIST